MSLASAFSASASPVSSSVGTARFPARSELDAYARFAPSLRLAQAHAHAHSVVQQMPQLSPTRFERPTDAQQPTDGPARLGASLEVPLAPAYADALDPLDPLDPLDSLDPLDPLDALDTPDTLAPLELESLSDPILDPIAFPTIGKDADWHVAAATASAHAAAAKLDVPVYPVLAMPSMDVHAADCAPPLHPGLGFAAAPGWSTTESANANTNPNANMDDLFSWFFNIANPPPNPTNASGESRLLVESSWTRC
jgi:hypothetical protein